MAGAGNDPWLSMTNATHYVLDGIPMRVAENYRPKTQKKNTLPPLRFNVAQSKVLNAKYEFKTENGYMQWHEALLTQAEHTREEKRRKEEEAERLRKEAATKVAYSKVLKSVDESHQKPVADPQHLKPKPAVIPIVSNSILLPQQASPVTVASGDQSESQASGVNIKDFESLAEDPFDNLELKTINEMKELESVLANTQLAQGVIGENINQNSNGGTQPESSTPGSDVIANEVEENVYENPTEIVATLNNDDIYENLQPLQSLPLDETTISRRKKGPIAAPRMTETVGNNLNRGSLVPSAKFNCQTDEVNIGSTGTPEPNTRPSVNIPSRPPPPPTKPKPTVDCKPMNNLSTVSGGATAKPFKPNNKIQSLANVLTRDLGNAVSRPPGAPKGFSYVSSSVNDTSTEDKRNVKDIKWPSLEQQTPTLNADHICPPFTLDTPTTSKDSVNIDNSQSKPLESGPSAMASKKIEVSKNGPSRPAPPRPTPAPPRPAPPSTRPTPPSMSSSRSPTLLNTSSQVVESLLTMGFERDQIIAAMKHIGSDTKKLVDHLCAVQKLTSNGSQWQSAEQAVMICGTDTSKAEKFAKAYQQLLEFGFGDGKIKEALLGCDMDMQRALDQLIS